MKKIISIIVIITVMSLVGCDFNTPQQEVTPTFQVSATLPLPTLTVTFTPSATATSVSIAQIQLESPTATFTPGTPTETPTPEPTLGPYEYTIQAGDTLFGIIQVFYNDSYAVANEVITLNGMTGADALPPVGTVLLIPRQTATPIPIGVEETQAALEDFGLDPITGLPDYPVGCHTVRTDESMVGIALEYGMTLEQLSVVNPDISFFGCDFDEPSGGNGCAPLIVENQCVNVFLPTVTPTMSPTPSGLETATPTPSRSAPIVTNPAEGALAPGGLLRLMWVSVGVLQPTEAYLIQVTDTTTGIAYDNQITRGTSLLLPESMIPTDGQTHLIQWSVSVAQQNDQGAYRIVSGTTTRTFQWQSR